MKYAFTCVRLYLLYLMKHTIGKQDVVIDYKWELINAVLLIPISLLVADIDSRQTGDEESLITIV